MNLDSDYDLFFEFYSLRPAELGFLDEMFGGVREKEKEVGL